MGCAHEELIEELPEVALAQTTNDGSDSFGGTPDYGTCRPESLKEPRLDHRGKQSEQMACSSDGNTLAFRKRRRKPCEYGMLRDDRPGRVDRGS